MADLKDITLFLLDMDGTVNLGYDPIDGAKEFLCTLKSQGKNFIFLTNNSSKSVDAYPFGNSRGTGENNFPIAEYCGTLLLSPPE